MIPTLSAAEVRGRSTFLGLMWALSHPGRRYTLDAAFAALPHNLALIGETLLDLETSFYTPDPLLSDLLARTSARLVGPTHAAYQFYPTLTAETLADVAQAPTGDMLYPDRAATIILGCDLGEGLELGLKGPGILGANRVRVGGIPYEFWSLHQRSRRYPLGWDLFLVDGDALIGIPRTTDITLLGA
jgi:alpha-D-ribose 1-methylphosphonate 5-triphosphate synthase subunit PhnH